MIVSELIVPSIRNRDGYFLAALLALLTVALFAPSVVAADNGASHESALDSTHGDPELDALLQEWVEANQAEDPRIEYAVNDNVGVFSDAEVDELTRRLEQHYEKTGVQMAVLVVDTTGSDPIADFSLRIAEEWGGGSAGRDDGLLFTLAISDRENRIEVGYGLESVIPDYYAARTLGMIRGRLRQEEYALATHQVIDRVVDATEHLEPGGARSPRFGIAIRHYYFVIIPVAVLISLLVGYVARRRSDDDAGLGPIAIAFFVIVPTVMLVFGSNLMEWIFLPLLAIFYITAGVFIASKLGSTPKLALFSLLFYAAVSGIGLVDLRYPVYWEPLLSSIGQNIAMLLVIAFLTTMVLQLPVIYGQQSSGSKDSQLYGSLQRARTRTRSRSSSSSSSSSRRSYSGGGGSFGGGGASGSW